jgi:hypothetical protein
LKPTANGCSQSPDLVFDAPGGDEKDPDREMIRAWLTKTGSFTCRIASDSMAPVLKTGDRVQVEAVPDPEKLERFDIIVFKTTDVLMCHFVWNHNRMGHNPGITTRSLLHPWSNEEPLGYASVIGKLKERRIPAFRQLVLLVGNFIRGSL